MLGLRCGCFIFAIALALSMSPVGAQSYPVKPVRVVTSEAGGGADLAARLAAQGWTAGLGQQVIIDNRPSALTSETVAKSAADGYTLLVNGSSIWISTLLKKTSYDPVVDLAPISLVSRAPNILIAHPSLPVKSAKDLIALARARPGELNYGSAGIGGSTHLSAELFRALAKINVVGVTYRGNGPSLNALVGGEVQIMFATAGTVVGLLKSGRVNALAVTTAQPSVLFPGLPTIAATGLPGYESATSYGAFAPGKTPTAIVERLNRDLVAFLNSAEGKERFLNGGMEPAPTTREQFTAIVKSDLAVLGKVIQEAGIRAE